ncbi:uncharacterized protein SCHCODRAFT_02665182 [Schizophyllum commune H4-8]|uniref:uncharacterized protein n=1 Tax=Schizophyllum commune (strain H4-8 / FGSC 9210) TaxID=578458 RepID=UPI00215E5DB9|nr:uncharacterized protein SCHCODRAFT_02665182 [Schizophyllum commune H4-8]KAI5894715.1 hypothetical protein SCHCODRAFT_02665182 [Schizophyllum commune H4-8]
MLLSSGAGSPCSSPRHLRLRDCAPELSLHLLAHPLAARFEDAALDVRLADLARLPAPTLRITCPVQFFYANVAATLVLTPHPTGAQRLTLGALRGRGGHYYFGGRSAASLGCRSVDSVDAAALIILLWRALGRSDRNHDEHVPADDPVLLAKFLVSLLNGLKCGLDKEKVEDYCDTPPAMPMVRLR